MRNRTTTDEDIRAYAERPWHEVAEQKQRYWAESNLTPVERLSIADGLRRSAKRLRPDWPDADLRADDIESHRRLAAVFLRIAS